ncbi:MAG: hypothetical protein DME09_11275 [Candidatus Rokuibacteriota bacterium]|nr:MAG: hypothetical protein DME09_11275 [Candidatus Rokubacteria bacterium]
MRAADIERYVRDYVRVSSWNRVKFDRLTAVLSHMHDRGIDCILLKGADLIPRLYGVLGLRPLGDVDMLVHECALPSLDLVLRQLGYRPEIDGNPAYRDPDGILALDIVTSLWYAHDQRWIWRRAVSRDVAGVPIKGLGDGVQRRPPGLGDDVVCPGRRCSCAKGSGRLGLRRRRGVSQSSPDPHLPRPCLRGEEVGRRRHSRSRAPTSRAVDGQSTTLLAGPRTAGHGRACGRRGSG